MIKILTLGILLSFSTVFSFGQNLIVDYPLNSNLTDNSSNSNSLTQYGNGSDVTFVQGNSNESGNSAAFFQGEKGLASTSSINNSNWSGTAISVWIKSCVSGTILQGASLGPGIFADANGKVSVYFNGSSANSLANSSSINLNDGIWHHIVAQNNGSVTQYYIDGELDGSQNESLYTLSSANANAKIYLGIGNPVTSQLDGYIDNFKLYDDTLTICQIIELYGQRPIVDYSFNQSLADSSLYLNHLVQYGNGNDVTYTQGHTSTSGNSAAFFQEEKGLASTAAINNTNWSGTAISVWVKSCVGGSIFQGAYFGPGIFADANGKVSVYFNGSSANSLANSSAIDLNDGVWHHVVVQNKGSLTQYYIDGELDGTQNESLYRLPGANSAAKIYLGINEVSTGQLDGYIDNFTIFDRTLKKCEIDSLYGGGGCTNEIVIDYDLDAYVGCQAFEAITTNNSTIASPDVISSYMWFWGDGSSNAGFEPTHSYATAGSYPIQLIGTSDNGCKDSIQKQVTVHPLPIAGFNAADLCLGDLTILTSTASVTTGSFVTTEWQVDGTVQSGTTISHQFPTANTYSVEQKVTTDSGCKDTIVSNIVINPLPAIDAALDEYEGCEPFDITTVNNSTIPSPDVISSYIWFWGDGSSNAGFEPVHTYAAAGSYSLKVIGTSEKGCIDSLSIATPVTVFANPVADFYYTPDDPSNLSDFVTFIDSSSLDVVQWDWSTSDNAIYSGTPALHTFTNFGNYTITLLATNANGCEDEKTKYIYIDADLFVHIPNAFSPNGDNLNDTYGLDGLTQGVEKINMTIFNQWGEQVFYTEDVNKKWDGNYNGSPAQIGVYIYIIKFTNPKQTQWYNYNGEIHLLR
jgi:gliding motility-associated-like protein